MTYTYLLPFFWNLVIVQFAHFPVRLFCTCFLSKYELSQIEMICFNCHRPRTNAVRGGPGNMLPHLQASHPNLTKKRLNTSPDLISSRWFRHLVRAIFLVSTSTKLCNETKGGFLAVKLFAHIVYLRRSVNNCEQEATKERLAHFSLGSE